MTHSVCLSTSPSPRSSWAAVLTRRIKVTVSVTDLLFTHFSSSFPTTRLQLSKVKYSYRQEHLFKRTRLKKGRTTDSSPVVILSWSSRYQVDKPYWNCQPFFPGQNKNWGVRAQQLLKFCNELFSVYATASHASWTRTEPILGISDSFSNGPQEDRLRDTCLKMKALRKLKVLFLPILS